MVDEYYAVGGWMNYRKLLTKIQSLEIYRDFSSEQKMSKSVIRIIKNSPITKSLGHLIFSKKKK